MAVSPVSITRISTNMSTMLLQTSLQKSMISLLQSQEQLSSMQKINRPSDNPIDATSAMRLDDMLSAQNQFLQNISNGVKVMNVADETTQSVYELALEAHDQALETLGSTSTSDSRESAATLITSMISQLVTLGNQEYLGSYMFAGTRSNEVPYTIDGNTVRYTGDQGAVTVQVSTELSEPINLTASQVFGTGTGQVTSDHDLNVAATLDTRIQDLKGIDGQGIRLGRLTVVGSVFGSATVDLSDVGTVGDVIDKINDALPAAVSVSLGADGRHLEITSANVGETLSISEEGQGTVAHDLGIYTSPAAVSPIVGSDFAPQLTKSSPVGALNGGAGIDLNSGIQITNGDRSLTLSFTGSTTVQDILNKINASNMGLEATLNAEKNGITITNQLAGSELRIAENGGTTANDLGICTFKTATKLKDLNGGLGVDTKTGNDFLITTHAGTQVSVDISGATTVGDVITQINAAAVAAGVGATLSAQVNPSGGGILVSDTSVGAADFKIERDPTSLSNAAEDLGIMTNVGAGNAIAGEDVNGQTESSVFSYMIQLRDALLNDDTKNIELAGEKLEKYIDEVTKFRGKLAFMAQALEMRQTRTEDAILSTKSMVSDLVDLDVAEAATEFQKRQTILQAALQSGSQILQTSLLDYL